MKITIVHTNNKKQLLVSTKTMEKLLQRIAKDDSRLTVTHFRDIFNEGNNRSYKQQEAAPRQHKDDGEVAATYRKR